MFTLEWYILTWYLLFLMFCSSRAIVDIALGPLIFTWSTSISGTNFLGCSYLWSAANKVQNSDLQQTWQALDKGICCRNVGDLFSTGMAMPDKSHGGWRLW